MGEGKKGEQEGRVVVVLTSNQKSKKNKEEYRITQKGLVHVLIQFQTGKYCPTQIGPSDI